MEQKSLKKNAFYSVLKVFLSLIFPLITFPYASRILLPEGIGKVNFANIIISYFIMLASLGIGSYTIREAAKVRDDKFALTKLFKEIITINFICCIIAYILFFISLFFIPKFAEYKDLLLICSIKIFFSVLASEWVYTANEDFKFITLRTFFVQLFSLIYLFSFVHSKEDIIHYTIFGIITAIGCNLLNFAFINKYINIHYKTKLELKKHLKPIIVFFGMTIITSIYTMLDTTMLGFLSNDIQIGYYSASTKLGHMVLSMLTAITSVLLPRLTNLIKNEDKSSFLELINKSANILLLLSFPMTAGIILLSKPLILLLSGNQFLSAILPMKIISPIIIFISFGSLIGVQILPALGKEKISFYSYLAGATSNIILNVLFIPKYGALGAAIGTVCAEFIVSFIQLIYIKKILINKKFIITLIHSIIGTMIISIIITFLINNCLKSVYSQLFICFIVGVIVYSFVLTLLHNEYFLFYFNKLIKKVLKKL